MTRTHQQQKSTAPYLAWLSVVLVFFFQYIIRVAPGAMVSDLRQDFGFTATEFSYLGAVFLYGYAVLQIPIGILIDRFGVRFITLASIVLCVLSTYLFAWTTQPWVAIGSRLLLGIGAAAPFICCLKIANEDIPEAYRGFFSGSILTVGTLGALCSGKPLSLLMTHFGWRGSLEIACLIGCGILIMSYAFLPKKQISSQGVSTLSLSETLRAVRDIILDKKVMLYGVVAVGLYTPLSVLADLWGAAFIMEKFKLSQAEAAQLNLSIYAGMMIGSIVLAWLAQRLHKLNFMIRICGILLVACFGLLLYGPQIPYFALAILLPMIGFLCGAEMICFMGVTQLTAAQTLGMTLALVNTLNMLGGALLQKAIGFGLDWQGMVCLQSKAL